MGTEMVKIAIIGAGAMGSVYAGLLREAGHEVWAIDIRQDHVNAIRKHGLRVEGASGDRVVTGLHAAPCAEPAGACDLYIIATKASGVGAAARSIAPLMTPDSLVLTIQNGLGAAERIAGHMSTNNVLLGVADGFGASIKGPGHVHHNAMKLIRLGEMNGGITGRLKRIEALWRGAGLSARAFGNIHQLIWEKYLCNVTLSAPCTVYDCTAGELRDHPEHWAVALACMMEAYQLGRLKGISFSFDDPVDYVTRFVEMMPDASPSMRLDHHARRRSEIDAINGMIPVLGAELGIATPYNEMLSTIVRERERGFAGAAH